MKILISPFHFREILFRGYSLDHIFLLRLINENMDISALLESPKIVALVQSLSRKGLINDEGNALTTIGKDLLIFMDSKEGKRLVKKKPNNSDFDLWWETYPSTNTFKYKGKSFQGDRGLRVKKDDCRTLFDKILLEGEYSATELIDALEYEVKQKLETSIKQNVNKMTYMQNSHTYLYQRTFENFIDLIKKGVVVEESNVISGGIDI